MSNILRSTRADPSAFTKQGDIPARPTFNGTRKDATEHTTAKWNEVHNTLDFENTDDYNSASRGLMARPENFVIESNEVAVWDMKTFDGFIPRDPPSEWDVNEVPYTVNPSLWRVAQLNMHYGLYEVTDKIYQVRGFDLSNITFVVGNTGLIVMDPLISKECSQMALSLFNYEVYTKYGKPVPRINTVIYSHSHIDHYGGIRGIIGPNDVEGVEIVASKGFTEDAVSENVIAGNAMSRRAVYMYGSLLQKDAKGLVCAGLGMTTSIGATGLLPPTKIIDGDYQCEQFDGVEMEFQFTPGTEAPTEMNTWFPQWNALWMAENTTNTMHNLLTLRGAQVRDALVWASYLTNTINRYGPKATVKFQSHHWPLWGQEKIVKYLERQRAIYQYTHDQSVRKMNKGLIGTEIASEMELPDSLNTEWSTRGYYGTLSHNSHAVYQRYMGWYTGNPSDLNKLPQEQAAAKYVEYMGDVERILDKAYTDFLAGNYRWVAEVLRHVVFNDSDNKQARYLLADTYEQLGYQAESGAWRGCYLQGANELRNDLQAGGMARFSEDVVRNMTPTMLFNYWGVHVDPTKFDFDKLVLNIHLTDLDAEPEEPSWYALIFEYGCMVASPEAAESADATITTIKDKLCDLIQGESTDDWLADEDVDISGGNPDMAKQIFDVFDMNDDSWFNIIEP